MQRLKPVEPVQAEPPVDAIFTGTLRGQHYNVYKALAASPAALRAAAEAQASLESSSLDPAHRVAIRLVTSQFWQSPCDLAMHAAQARALGMSDGQITQIRRGVHDDQQTASLIAFARALHDKLGRVSDADVAAVRAAGFDDRAIADAVAEASVASFLCMFNVFNRTAPDAPIPPQV